MAGGRPTFDSLPAGLVVRADTGELSRVAAVGEEGEEKTQEEEPEPRMGAVAVGMKLQEQGRPTCMPLCVDLFRKRWPMESRREPS
jgi:hypothetical protein